MRGTTRKPLRAFGRHVRHSFGRLFGACFRRPAEDSSTENPDAPSIHPVAQFSSSQEAATQTKPLLRSEQRVGLQQEAVTQVEAFRIAERKAPLQPKNELKAARTQTAEWNGSSHQKASLEATPSLWVDKQASPWQQVQPPAIKASAAAADVSLQHSRGGRVRHSSVPHPPPSEIARKDSNSSPTVPSRASRLVQGSRKPSSPNRERPTKSFAPPLIGTVINNRFEVQGFVGAGGFGEVYKGVDRRTEGKVAIKRSLKATHELNFEKKIYLKLRGNKQHIYFPRMHHFENFNGRDVLVLDMMGPSLEAIEAKDGFLRDPEVSKLACDVLSCLKALHSIGYIHCDLKPGNILSSANFNEREARDLGEFYLVDFGLAQPFMNGNGEHLEPQWLDFGVGTVEFAPITTHKGFAQSRRDDIFSLGLLILHAYGIRFPWSAKEVLNDWDLVGLAKGGTPISTICKRAPEMREWFLEVGKLGYKDEPDYEKFKNIATRLGEKRPDRDLDITLGNLFC